MLNFSKLLFSERDDLERKLNESQAKCGAIEAKTQVLTKERDDLIRKVSHNNFIFQNFYFKLIYLG